MAGDASEKDSPGPESKLMPVETDYMWDSQFFISLIKEKEKKCLGKLILRSDSFIHSSDKHELSTYDISLHSSWEDRN